MAVGAAAGARAAGAPRPRISCKIRLLPGEDGGPAASHARTVALGRVLEDAGCELLVVHCRPTTRVRHGGPADFAAGRALVAALRIPVVVNGGVTDAAGVRRALAATGAHGVMIAQGFLANPRLLRAPAPAAGAAGLARGPACLAAEYLAFAERFPPPSALFVRKHLRWFFRAALQPPRGLTPAGERAMFNDPVDGWKPRLWTFLVRPWLRAPAEFRAVVALYCRLAGVAPPESVAAEVGATFTSIRAMARVRQKREEEDSAAASD
jgi:hypothetical protein